MEECAGAFLDHFAIVGHVADGNSFVRLLAGPDFQNLEDGRTVPSHPEIDWPAFLVDFFKKEPVLPRPNHELVLPCEQ